MPIADDLALRRKVEQLNSTFKEVQDYKREHPEARAGYYPNNYGSLLNAYREGDLSFEEAKAQLAEVAAQIAESQVSPVADPEANEVARIIAERIRALKSRY